jgi:hypothetical protein
MTVKDLIAELKKMGVDREVIISSDAEGNSYRPVDNIEVGAFCKEDGEYGIEILTEDLIQQGYTGEDVIAGVPCVCIWPA